MLFLNPNDPVKKSLEALCNPIARISADCVQMIFGKECTTSEDWKIVDRLNGDFPHNICLGCGNNDFQALAVIGTGNDEITEFIDSLDANDILDAFGEMLNTYFGMLMDNSEFVKHFGILTQSISQYSADVNFYPKAWGCSGTLVTPQKGVIYVGFAIKGNQPVQL